MSTGDDRETIEGLRERLLRLETAIEATGLGLWEWDLRTGALTWNARKRELFGVEHNDPLTIQDYPQLVHPDDLELVRTTYREASEQPEGGVFSMEHRTLAAPGGKTRWVLQRGRVIRDAEGVRLAVGSTVDITDRKSAEERRSLVLRELAHRAKNGILVMMTIVGQTAKGVTSVQEFQEVLMARLRSMADSQDLVTQASGRSLRLMDLLDRALTPFDRGRFEVDPRLREVSISHSMVVAMALLLHELSTNAVKYGALSTPSGRVTLARGPDREGVTCMHWIEAGGPEVKPLVRQGFGTRLLDVSLRNDGGHIEAHFDRDGFRAAIHFPNAPA